MNFEKLAEVYEKIERTRKRLEMTDYLVRLLKDTTEEDVDKVIYLTLGRVYPPFIGIELGLADKLTIKAISYASGAEEADVLEEYKKIGDIGKTAELFVSTKNVKRQFTKPLTVDMVYESLEEVCRVSGKGAQEKKIRILSHLLVNSSPRQARYIARMVTGRLRLGIGDMTILDALAIAYGGGKEARVNIERAYNISCDIGLVAKTLFESGLDGIKNFKVTVKRPVKVQMAERLQSLKDILERLGRCSAEFKYDGMRMEAHVFNDDVRIFSRREEDITSQFPDVVKALREAVVAKEAILDGEAVPVDPNTKDLLPFQAVSHRRGRKYRIEEMIEEVPITLFLFDILYVDGVDYTYKSYLERRGKLYEVVKETDKVKIAENIISDDAREIEKFFLSAIQRGGEGIICKSIGPDSFYEAGKRGFKWIKLKRSYRSKMADTVDLVVVGAFRGKGRRAGTYGALLMAAYNSKNDSFETVCKLGSGFTDEDLSNLPNMLSIYRIPHIHPRVYSSVKADYWFTPKMVLEVIGDEITLSPTHTCAYNLIREDSGLAIRFPRLVKFRSDREAEDATTVREIVEMYHAQLKKIT